MINKENRLSLYRIYLLFTLALTLVGVITNTLMLSKYYEPEHFGFASDAPQSIEFVIPLIVGIGVLVFFSLYLTMGKKAFPKDTMPTINIPTKIASVIVSLSLLLTAVFQFVFANSSDHLAFANLLKSTGALSILHTACAIISILALVYFARDFVSSDKSVIFGIAFVIWCALYTMRVYFDMNTVLSDPRRILSIVAMCCAILFIHAEFRLYTGSPMHTLYTVTAMATALICIISGLPSVILNIAGSFSDGIQTSYYVCEGAIGLYALARLYSLANIDAFTEKAEEVYEIDSEQEYVSDTEETLEAPEEVAEIAEGSDEGYDISREELAKMYKYVYLSVASRMTDSYLSESGKEESIKAATLSIIEGIFKDDEGKNERIEALRQAMSSAEESSEEVSEEASEVCENDSDTEKSEEETEEESSDGDHTPDTDAIIDEDESTDDGENENEAENGSEEDEVSEENEEKENEQNNE